MHRLFRLGLSASLLAITAGALAAQEKSTAQTKSAAPSKPAASRVVWPDEGPSKWAPRPTVSAITANDLRTRLYGISDDSMQGRRIGERGNYRTTEYIAREFKRMGLKPAGDNGTYFQVLAFGPTGYDSAASTLQCGSAPFARSAEWVPLAPNVASGVAGKADVRGVAAAFAGRWGDTVALDPALVRGKVAVFLAPPAAPRPAPVVLRCDSVPDRFGAQAACDVHAVFPGQADRPQRQDALAVDDRVEDLGDEFPRKLSPETRVNQVGLPLFLQLQDYGPQAPILIAFI